MTLLLAAYLTLVTTLNVGIVVDWTLLLLYAVGPSSYLTFPLFVGIWCYLLVLTVTGWLVGLTCCYCVDIVEQLVCVYLFPV